VVRDRRPDAHLLVIGPLDATDPPPAGVLAELRADPRVRMPGEDWNVAPLYRAMDLFCLPSYREGCPTVVLEAAAMALPTVAFRVSGVVDAVEDGVTGRLVEPLCARQLADAIDDYLGNPELRRRHGDAARRRATTRFSQDVVWKALRTFYLSFADEPTAAAAVAPQGPQCTDAI
jgi:glycosyltransferase involved in cell wall biosynthesis